MARPFVYINMAMTADGKITSATREYPKFTSDADRENMDRLRAEADAVLVGAGTLRADDPPMRVRDPAMQAYRRSLGRPDVLTNVVVTASVDLDPGASFFASGSPATRVVATVEDAPPDRVARLDGLATVWRVGRGRVDLPALLVRLAEELRVGRLLLEGGGEMNWQFLRQDLVDELHVTVAPALLGGRDAPTLLEGDGFAMDAQRRLTLSDVRRVGDEVFCRYEVVRA
jgi:2,5-diamino-6-hydroxy-4-(5-phosphoribosylamino)pyrimidine 1'-reductase